MMKCPSIKGKRKKGKKVDWEFCFIQVETEMEIFMKVSSKMMNIMGKEYTLGLMEIDMKDNS